MKSIIAKGLLLVTLAAPLSGCVWDINATVKEMRRPKVEFATPGAWRCDHEASQIPTKSGLQSCDVCLNTSQVAQAVTIEKIEHSIRTGGQVAICPTSAFPL